jgi:hypothetical protein
MACSDVGAQGGSGGDVRMQGWPPERRRGQGRARRLPYVSADESGDELTAASSVSLHIDRSWAKLKSATAQHGGAVELVVLQVVGLDSDEFRASADGLRRRRRRRRVHPAQWRCRKDAEEYQQSRGNGWMRSRACRRVPRRRHGQRQWQRRRGHLDDAGLHECSWTRMGARLGL